MEPATAAPWYARNGWRFVTALALLIVAFGLFVLFVPVDAGDFESETGVVWDVLTDDTPAVAGYLEREARLLGVTAIGLGALTAGLGATLLRRGDRTAWALVWVFPAALALYAVVFFGADAAALGGTYAAAAALAAAATVAAKPRA